MLRSLDIYNLATIEHVTIDFSQGLTVITGETGAGKSIMLDAIELALGHRADSSMIRGNSSQCKVTLSIDTSDSANQWLVNNECDDEGACVIQRTVNREGRSRASINGFIVPLQKLKELSYLLVNLHGQHQHQTLLHADTQRELLDAYAGLESLASKVKICFHAWRTSTKKLAALVEAQKNQNDRSELLTYQLKELNELDLLETEFIDLEKAHKLSANSENIEQQCRQLLAKLNQGDKSAIQQLHYALQELQSLISQGAQLSSSNELINSAIIHIEESVSELQDYTNNLQFDPQLLHEQKSRLSDIYDLARKHHTGPENLYNVHQQLQEELATFSKNGALIEALQKQVSEEEKAYQKEAATLTKKRTNSAEELQKEITTNMQTLNMSGGQLFINIVASDTPLEYGMEHIEFTVSTNPGQSAQSLKKVVSGGELSRISLAIQTITAKKKTLPTLIFDEVDVGIGGKTADVVGKQIRTLSDNAQVICITHLPQVAIYGHQHLLVAKETKDESTFTSITPLDKQQTTEEIARMLGGAHITKQTVAHAQELLDTVA